MKQTFIVLIAVLAFVGCSKDDNSDEGLTSLQRQLIGVWNTSQDLTGNTYTYNEDGTAVYVNDYGGDIDVYQGYWDIVEGNVLIEFYPDPYETVEGWQENPTLKNTIELLDEDYTLMQTDYHEATRINYLYREGLKEDQKVSEQTYVLEFVTGELEDWVSVFAETTIYNADGTKTEVSTEVDREAKTLEVEIPEDVYRFDIMFYIEDASQVEMKFFGVDDGKVLHQETINQQSYEFSYVF
ncbi:putative periplasmic lipoprotein [Maribacter dokdonensis]|uniref:hypothetical protein n=1 Tax=Maribacter dokdonensis TaxID=320912 RepID=UPI002AB1016E|nr:hypothetical protein [Maribacter dokdonensis]